jgi:ABC-type amino acid transport substrate-binding protein
MDILGIADLKWTIIAGDRHSQVEQFFTEKDLKNKIRIFQTESKDKSMQLLKKRKVVAVVMPRAVGFHLAQKHKLDVKILDTSAPKSPVAIAVKKGNKELLNLFEAALLELQKDGALDAVFKKWRVQETTDTNGLKPH